MSYQVRVPCERGSAKLQCDTEQLKSATSERGSTENHGVAGNPFAPPGTLRSRPASPYVEAGPSHGRSISLPQADLPAPAALAEHAASLSLPHPSQTVSLALAPAGSQCTHLPRSVLVKSLDQLLHSRLSRRAQVTDGMVSFVQGLTGAQLYQMHQSPMPEEGEVFRPAKDILQEIFFSRVSQDAAPEALDSATDGKQALGSIQGLASTPDQAEGGQNQQQHSASNDEQALNDSRSFGGAAAECAAEKSAGGSKLSDEAQGWNPMRGAAGLPAIATGRSLQANGASGGASIARTGSLQQLDTAEGNAWESAWQGFQSAEAPDQAAGQAPAQAAAARPSFTLLLPSREPPLPPAQLPEPSAAQPSPGHSTLPAMRSDDRQKCMQFFKQVRVTCELLSLILVLVACLSMSVDGTLSLCRHPPEIALLRTWVRPGAMEFQGYAAKGGVSASAAQQLHARSGAAAAFEAIWDLVSPGTVSASLDCAGFCLFMHLLKTSMKGIQLPAAIAPEQVHQPILLPFTIRCRS